MCTYVQGSLQQLGIYDTYCVKFTQTDFDNTYERHHFAYQIGAYAHDIGYLVNFSTTKEDNLLDNANRRIESAS